MSKYFDDLDSDSSSESESEESELELDILSDLKQYDIQLIGPFSSKVKYFPWQSWQEWSSLCIQIINVKQRPLSESEQRECLRILTKWLTKNTSVVSSQANASAHSKYLKM